MVDVIHVRDRIRAYRPGIESAPQMDEGVNWDSNELTAAAVLVAVIARAEPTVLFTKRNAELRTHAGQVAFPGGRLDPGEDAIMAALREAEEEIALPRHEVEILAPIDDYATGTGFRITPVVGIIRPDLPFRPHQAEVESVFEVPLAHLLDPANHEQRVGEWRGKARTYYAIPWEPDSIWGATAGMVVNFARVLGAVS